VVELLQLPIATLAIANPSASLIQFSVMKRQLQKVFARITPLEEKTVSLIGCITMWE